jgi:hypothetical protein
MKPNWYVAVIVPFLGMPCLGTNAFAQTWNYKVATEGGGTPGSVSLEHRDGKPVVRMHGRLNDCWARQELKAQVTKTVEATTITVAPAMIGCEEIRFVIKNDGTGGVRQIKNGGDWADDGFERDLTLRK